MNNIKYVSHYMAFKLHIIVMDITQWYAIALRGLVPLSITTAALLTALTITRKYTTFRFLKHVYYPQVHRYLRGFEKTTQFDFALIAVFLLGNMVCTVIQVNDVSNLARRSGLLSVINLMPLTAGSHMNLIANSCGIRLGAYRRMHRWIGRVAAAEGLVHTAARVSLHLPDLQTLSDIVGLTVSFGSSFHEVFTG